MLSLFETTRTALIKLGQVLVPVGCNGFDYAMLEEVFLNTLYEYLEHVPIVKSNIFRLDNAGIDVSTLMKEVKFIKPHFLFDEFNDRMEIESWEFTRDKRLTAVIAMDYYVEYFAEPSIDNWDFDYKQTTILPTENSYKFFLKAHFKKGSLILTLVDNLTSFELHEDLTSYDYFTGDFTVDTVSNILTVPLEIGKRLNTYDYVELSSLGTLPSPFLPSVFYYVIKLSDTNIQLASNILNAQNNTPIDITTIGTGTHSLKLLNDTENINTNTEILLTGTMGTGTVNLLTLEVKIKITAVLNPTVKKTLNVHLTQFYKACRDFNEQETLFIKLYSGYLAIAIGTNKSLLKITDFPFDVTNDDLVTKGNSIIEKTLEEINDRKGFYEIV